MYFFLRAQAFGRTDAMLTAMSHETERRKMVVLVRIEQGKFKLQSVCIQTRENLQLVKN